MHGKPDNFPQKVVSILKFGFHNRDFDNREIKKALRPILKRLLVQHYLIKAFQYMAVITLVTGLFLVISFFYPWPEVFRWCMAVAGVVGISFFIWAYLTRPDYYQAAIMADRDGLKERAITALELSGQNDRMTVMQRTDALMHLKQFDARAQYPFFVPRREIAVCLAALLVITLCMALPGRTREEIEHRAELRKAIAQEVEKIGQLKEQLEEKQNQTRLAEREEAINILEELQVEMQENSDSNLKRSLKSISRAEEKLAALKNSGRESSQSDIANIIDALKANEVTRELGEKISAGDVEQARDEMEKFLENAESETGNKKDTLADVLEKAAANLSDTQLALQLNQAGQAVRSGGTGGSPQMETLDRILGMLCNQAGWQTDYNRVTTILQNARYGLLAAGEESCSTCQAGNGINGSMGSSGGNNSSGAAANGGSGNSNNSESGSGQESSMSGSQGAGSGAGRGIGSGAETQLQQNRSSPTSPGSEWAGMDFAKYEKIFDPERIGEAGESSFVQGEAGEGPQQTVTTTDPAVMTGNLRPYREVIGYYSQAARDSLNRSSIPPEMSDLVRDYFSSLEE